MTPDEIADIERRILARLTAPIPGLTPGYYNGLSVGADGRIRRAEAASGATLQALYELHSNTTRGGGGLTRINFGDLIYDPQSLVTTGTSWKFVPASNGTYAVTVSTRIVPSAAFVAGDKLYLQLWPDATGSGIIDLAQMEVGITETATRSLILLHGRKELYATTSSAINVRIGNGTANSVSQRGTLDQNYSTTIAIEKLA